MERIPTFDEFKKLNESLVILDLKGMMKNEFMNNIELKQDFETAKRLLFDNGKCLFSHVGDDQFILRTHSTIETSDMDSLIKKINEELKKFQFKRIGSPKKNVIKENIWKVKAKLL
jgi:hypothetical protein